MKVRILEHTPNPERLVANAARLCYSNATIDDLFNKYTDEENEAMIQRLADLGHESPLEHVSFTFGIEGVSRSLTHQLTRHRVASYSQQSQRYVKLDSNSDWYIVPDEVLKTDNERVIEAFKDFADATGDMYDLLIENGLKAEDARALLPNMTKTNIIVTMNVRSLLNFFRHRCCNRAQNEIQQLADEMLRQVKEIAPTLFAKAGAACTHGKCSEGKMSCGENRKEKYSLYA